MKKASVFAVEESCGRQQMLDKVFRKALSVSVNSISDTDLNECFGELRTPFGSAFGKVFINMMGRGEASMDAAYTDLCIRHDMDDKLRALESAPPAPRLDLTSPDPLAATLLELKRLEADELRAANKHVSAGSTLLPIFPVPRRSRQPSPHTPPHPILPHSTPRAHTHSALHRWKQRSRS